MYLQHDNNSKPIKSPEIETRNTTKREAKNIYPPGDLALWIFICAELLVFGIFFVSYAFTRANHIELFNQYQTTLNTNLALFNTLALLTSSYFVVNAIIAIKNRQQKNLHSFCF